MTPQRVPTSRALSYPRWARMCAMAAGAALLVGIAVTAQQSPSEAATSDAASGRPVFCAGGHSGTAVNLVDADPSTAATFEGGHTLTSPTTATPADMSCTVDLGEPLPVTQALISFGVDGVGYPAIFSEEYCKTRGIIDWQLEGSVDGQTWLLYTAPLTGNTSNHSPGAAKTVDINSTAEFLRLTVAACWGQTYGVKSLQALTAAAVGRNDASQMDARHNPPLLIVPGEAAELEYDAICRFHPLDTVGCEPSGQVFLTRNDGTQRTVTLNPGDAAHKWRLWTAIPADFLTAGTSFTYYATIRDDNTGASVTLPDAGVASPQHAFVANPTSQSSLSATTYPAPATPSATVVSGSWGGSDGQFGLTSGDQQARSGPTSFDVAGDGTTYVLDGVNGRLVSVAPSGLSTSLPLAVQFPLERADLAVASNGALVLSEAVDTTTPGSLQLAVVSTAGKLLAGAPIAGGIADQVRSTPAGTFVHVYPDDAWQGVVAPIGASSGAPETPGIPATAAGEQLVSKVTPTEARFALVSNGTVSRFWRVTSPDQFGELQLAQLDGNDLVVVFRQFDDTHAQFRVLRMTSNGSITRDLIIDTAEYAETSPVSKFRLNAGQLFMARSDTSGFSVARYSLGAST